MAALLVSSVVSLALPTASATLVPSSATRLAVVSAVAEATPPLRESHEDALIQADAGHMRYAKARQPNPAAWFGGFHSGESTYTHDGLFDDRNANPEIEVADGWEPKDGTSEDFFEPHQAEDKEFFVESRSGGAKQAWQTAYPALGTSIAGNEVDTGAWFEDTAGNLQQEYVSASTIHDGHGKNNNIPASWFDDSVNQLDGFGRMKLPAPGSPRNWVEWEEKSSNTTMTCKDAGCTAKVTLVAPFDAAKEIAKNCRLSVFFHPTDFDDQYSGESVEWVQVNNKQVSSNCRPFQSGCNQTAQRPLLPCFNDLPVDTLLPANGELTIAAKIPKIVDECPYNGNLLSGVPMVTCLVSPKPNVTQPPKPVQALMQQNYCITKMPLQCTTRGCASEITIPINKSCYTLGQTCKLSIDVQQTDYDNKEGTEELIEYIKVDGKQVASKLKPGQNPCKSAWHGKPLAAAEKNFSALKDHVLNVTGQRVVIEGKITQYVDECASNGYLFDALATVKCEKPAGAKLLQTEEAEPGLASRHMLRGSGS